VAGCTGAQSEMAVQKLYGLPDHAMLDMGDFVGGLVKYLVRHPVARLTVGGGIGKLSKLAQGARDLHSSRTQVDTAALAALVGMPEVASAATALHALDIAGPPLARAVAEAAKRELEKMVESTGIEVDVVLCDRGGRILARAQ
jgi:cobalt-precorrin-5B (C1)-methyltransferase